MSKRQTAATLTCPHCGGSLAIVAGSSKQTHGKRAKRRRSGGSHRYESTAPAPFAHTAAAVAPPKRQWRPEPEPVTLPSAPSLQPGEEHSAKAYRQRTGLDTGVALVEAVSTGAIAFALASGAAGVIRALLIPPVAPWLYTVNAIQRWIGAHWWLFGTTACLGAIGYLWFRHLLPDLLDDEKLITTVQESARQPDAPPVTVAPPSAEVIVQSADGKAQKRAKLYAPATNPSGLWQYADALARDTAAPSYEGGKHVNGASAFGYTPTEFDGREDSWRPTAITGGLLEDDPEKSKGYRLTPDGQLAMEQIAKHRLGEYG